MHGKCVLMQYEGAYRVVPAVLLQFDICILNIFTAIFHIVYNISMFVLK